MHLPNDTASKSASHRSGPKSYLNGENLKSIASPRDNAKEDSETRTRASYLSAAKRSTRSHSIAPPTAITARESREKLPSIKSHVSEKAMFVTEILS